MRLDHGGGAGKDGSEALDRNLDGNHALA